MKRAIVIPDQHFPIHDESAVKVVLKAIEFVKPDIFINLGDTVLIALIFYLTFIFLRPINQFIYFQF